jgi:hypothetical protein
MGFIAQHDPSALSVAPKQGPSALDPVGSGTY